MKKVTTSQGLKRVQGYSTWLARSESGSIPGTTWLAWVIWPWALTLNNHNSWPIIHFQFHQMFPKCPARQIFLCSWSQWYVTDMHGDAYWLQFNFRQFHCLLWHWPLVEHKPILLRNVPQFPFVWCFPMIKYRISTQGRKTAEEIKKLSYIIERGTWCPWCHFTSLSVTAILITCLRQYLPKFSTVRISYLSLCNEIICGDTLWGYIKHCHLVYFQPIVVIYKMTYTYAYVSIGISL